jgi:hypothetical protein
MFQETKACDEPSLAVLIVIEQQSLALLFCDILVSCCDKKRPFSESGSILAGNATQRLSTKMGRSFSALPEASARNALQNVCQRCQPTSLDEEKVKEETDAMKFLRRSASMSIGIGMQIAVADLNADGRLDTVVSGKTGTWILLNEGR